MTKELIAEKVRQEIAGVEVPGITLQVMDEDVYQANDYWRVPVRPSRWPKRMFDFYEAMSAVEEELQDTQHLKIVIETGEPLDEGDDGDVSGAMAEREIQEHGSFQNGQRGLDAHLFPQKPHVVVLSPDVAAVFPNSDSVNEALRVLVKAAQASMPTPQEREAA